ncbi:hypothetical protein AB2M62_08905 [Sphingomonas sp. MMS12-HWE2-04]|uniref:hypothetical protein n=1 Tax=Sphingomonas sp. MMS12-HWE2-04 TaxID=3234199 RepID=UPI00384D8C38
MKFAKIIAAAGLAVASIASAAPAEAQSYRDHRGGYERQYDHGRYRDHDRRWDRDHDRRWDRGRHHGWDRGRSYRGRSHRVCWTEWRHHHRETVCRRR